MHLKVARSVFTPTATLGKMFIDDDFFAFTLEDVDRNLNGDCSKKVQNQTAIDGGAYTVVLSFSNHFNKVLPEVQNVKCFEGIRIHGGNTDADTEGCILIGAESNMHDRIWDCAGKVAELVEKMKELPAGENISIEIVKE
ncbi:MAG TPA: DUF5675 family protein [Chitinophagaceae bacterium]|nr:DUF5675 family protein [Chitinophagaceae bacterium]